MESGAGLGAALALGPLAQAAGSGNAATEAALSSAVATTRLIRERKVSALEVVQQCLARIEALNPRLNAMVTVCAQRALEEAAAADARLARGEAVGPLHGVPFTANDSLDSAGVVSTAGTLGRRHFVPVSDATVIARARAAGAILLGKTNTAELSWAGPGHATENLVSGATRNPYDTQKPAGGGSGGAGTAIAAGFACFDFGSGDAGALREPASANGVAGLKPTLGRLARTGHVLGYGGPFDAFTQLAPLARRVEDLSLLLPILCGPDGADATLAPVPLHEAADVKLDGLRIAWCGMAGAAAPAEVQQAVARFERLGAQASAAAPPQLDRFVQLASEYQGADGGAWLRRLLTTHGSQRSSPPLSLADKVVPSSRFSELCESLDAIRREQLTWVESYDLLVCPALLAAPPGWPAGIVRVGNSPTGLPLAVQLVAQPWHEDVLLAALLHLERETGGWQPPPA